MHTGKCPKCDKVMSHVTFEEVDVREPYKFNGGWRGVSYQCPYCRVVLSVEIDPVALKTDLINQIKKEIKR